MEYLRDLEPPIVHGDLKGLSKVVRPGYGVWNLQHQEKILVDNDGHAILNDFGLSTGTQDA